MKKPEEIKKGLECCVTQYNCHIGDEQCCYHGGGECHYFVMCDALSYIQQLEARLVDANKTSDELEAQLAEYEKPLVPMTLEEAKALRGVWIEDDGCCWGDDEPHPAMWDGRVNGHFHQFIDEHYSEEEEHVYFEEAEYGKTWRCWARKPTDEERKAVKWDD